MILALLMACMVACTGTEQPGQPGQLTPVDRSNDGGVRSGLAGAGEGGQEFPAPTNRSTESTRLSSELEIVDLPVGGHIFTVELAQTAAQREQGLMFRRELPADGGMLFMFEESAPRAFWMRNTYVPLSIAYIDARGRILEIYDMEPLSEALVRSRSPAKYALEVNQGRFSEVGVSRGDVLDLSVLPRR